MLFISLGDGLISPGPGDRVNRLGDPTMSARVVEVRVPLIEPIGSTRPDQVNRLWSSQSTPRAPDLTRLSHFLISLSHSTIPSATLQQWTQSFYYNELSHFAIINSVTELIYFFATVINYFSYSAQIIPFFAIVNSTILLYFTQPFFCYSELSHFSTVVRSAIFLLYSVIL
jgi:hypothetical protein